MSRLRKFAQLIRHLPGLDRAEWLWNLMRAPYHRVLGARGRGVSVRVGGACDVRMPPEFSGQSLEDFEPESVKALTMWVRENPAGLVLDVGCSIGIVSLCALSASDRISVIAFDSDLASLKATQRMTSFVAGQRLRTVHGFVSNEHRSDFTFDQAVNQTTAKLQASGMSGDIGTNRYTCIHTDADASIPTHSLDGLLGQRLVELRPMLIKIDIEGAEQLALEGAQRLLKTISPALLLSVHPPVLPTFGHSSEGLREWLQDVGYTIKVLGVDHEEHWWCEHVR